MAKYKSHRKPRKSYPWGLWLALLLCIAFWGSLCFIPELMRDFWSALANLLMEVFNVQEKR